MKQQGYVLFFFIWCLSHLGSNEVRAVMVAAGSCSAPRLKKKGARSSESGERVLLVEHLSDLVHAVTTTPDCRAPPLHSPKRAHGGTD